MTEQEKPETQEAEVVQEVEVDLEAREYRGKEIYKGDYEVRPGLSIPKEKYLNTLAKIPVMLVLAESQRVERLTKLQEADPEAACHWQNQAVFDETKFRSENDELFPSLAECEEDGHDLDVAAALQGDALQARINAEKEKDDE